MMLIRTLNDEHDLVKTGAVFEEKCKDGAGDSGFFLLEGQAVSILDFVGHVVSVKTTQPCRCSVKVAIHSGYKQMDRVVC